ncbi:hypothetical protein [Streptomyces sp. SID3343]|uniref:hypothetical protein n=1 Tax=Streptomyces sp. SID3343 TaxID=2690260 RepID=UPI00136B945F|nr:hypothetical protein [Streptomyces sp. SID3343]MYW05675.1 hypothetical protein [Streptomyces sp. SID3343]
MNDEQQLRTELRQFADRVSTSPAPVAEVVRRGTAIRRRLTLVRGAMGVVVVMCSAVVAVGLGHSESASGPAVTQLPAQVPGPSSSASIGPAPGTPSPGPSAPAPPVRTVAPGEQVTAEAGRVLWLTADGQHVVEVPPAPGQTSPAEPQAKKVLDGNLGFGSINVRVFGGSDGALYTGAFRYQATLAPARVTIEFADRTLDAHVLTLAGSPGWAVYYLDAAPVSRDVSHPSIGGGTGVVVAYAADGTVLARSDRPPTSR